MPQKDSAFGVAINFDDEYTYVILHRSKSYESQPKETDGVFILQINGKGLKRFHYGEIYCAKNANEAYSQVKRYLEPCFPIEK